MNASLHAVTEELRFFKAEHDNQHDYLIKQCEDYQKSFEEFKNRLQECQKELSTVCSEKYFLQRFCNDLKVALKSHVNQNQVSRYEFL